MFKKIYLFLIILVCLFVISAVSAEDNSTSDIVSVSNDVNSLEANSNMDSIVNDTDTLKVSNDELLTAGNNWYVNGSKTSSGDGKSEATAFVSLKEAIDSASDGDTVMIASGEYKGTNNTGLEITKILNFIKYGDSEAIFDSESQSRIWTVTATSINMTGLSFRNGRAINGGAIYINGSSNVFNCSFVNCSSYSYDSSYRYSYGGAIYFTGFGSVTNCSFVNCSSYSYNSDSSYRYSYGGAIYFTGFGSVTNCSFVNCSSSSSSNYGGAISIGSGNITDCSFVNCSSNANAFDDDSGSYGGAIYFKDSGNVVNCSFNNSQSRDGNMCSGSSYGGAICFKGDGNVYNCSFVNCHATTSDGNTVFAHGTSGGAIYFGYDSSGNVVNCSFVNCSSSSFGGAICFKGDGNVYNCSFVNCFNYDYRYYYGTNAGGAIYFTGSGSVSNCSFVNCFSYIRTYGSGEYMSMSDCHGGAISIDGSGNITDCSFVNCSSSSSSSSSSSRGGAISIAYSGNITDCSFVNCSSTSSYSSSSRHYSYACAISIGSGNITDCSFINCNANEGNAIYFYSDGIVTNSIFLNNGGSNIKGNCNVTANYNWFGNNATNYNIKPKVGENITMTNWLFLNATANPTELNISETSTITFKLYSYNDTSKQVTPYNTSKMNIILDLTQTLGELNKNTTLIGEEILYTAKQSGNGSVTGNFETAHYTINLKNTGDKKENLTILASANPITIGENANVIVTGLKDATGNVTVTVNGKTYTGSIKNSEAKVIVPGLTETVTANVNYPGDEKYNPASTTVKITVNPKPKENLTISASAEPITVGENANVIVTGLKDATGNVTVTVNGKTYTGSIKDGGATVIIPSLTNSVTANVNYSGDEKYNLASTTVKIVVNKIYDYNIIAENLTIYKGQSAEIVVNVPSDATGNIVLYILSEEYILPIIDGKATFVISDLSGYSMCGFFAVLMDDPKYELKEVYGTITILSKVSNYTISSPNVDVYCGETANITVYLPQDATGRLKVLYDGLDIGYVYINEGVATFEATYQISCVHIYDFYYEGDYKYTPKSTSVILTVHKFSDYSFNTTDVYITTGETANIIADLPKDTTGTANIRVFNENFEYADSTTVNEGQIIFNIGGLLKDAEFIIDYLGDYRYESKSVSGSIFVKNSIVINAPDVTKYYGGSEKFIVTLTDKNNPISNADVEITIDGKTITRTTDSNGKIFVDLNQNMGTYVVTINYENLSNTSKVIINPAPTKTVLSGVKDINVGDSLTVTATVNATTGSVTFKINSKTQTVDIVNNKASYTIADLSEGSYNIGVSYNDVNGNYLSSSDSASFIVSKISPKLLVIADDIGEGQDAIFEITTNEDCTGDINILIDGKNYKNSLSDGKTIIKVPNLTTGDYNYTVSFLGDKKYSSKSINGTINVKNINVILNAPDLIKYYGSADKLSAQLLDKSNKPLIGQKIIFTVNGRDYERITDNLGIASMNINLISGNHIAGVRFEGNGTYDAIKTTVQIQIKSTVSGNNVTKIFRNGTQYYAKFVDTKGNLMKNTDVEFNINGVFYTRTTNENGVAKMNINLPPGTYIITAENPNSKEKYTNLIKVLPSIVENYDLTKYYKNASKYTLRIIGDDGKPVGQGVIVKLNINGVFYERKTNATGYMNMNINLPPGTYTVTAEYNGLRASNKITVLSVLETKNLVMKYKDGSKFEAKVLDGQGKPYAGQTVTFNINGVFYTKTTEADGIARLKINLLAGEYIITSMYNGLNSANKVTISG